MAIIQEPVREMQGGFAKEIDSSSVGLVFDILQKYQYAYPVKSTVRELLSNGLDSIAEKNMAREILSGRKKVEDFYVEKEGDIYQDSHFDPTYYDTNWLDRKNEVSLTYVQGSQMAKDKVIIADTGVGLGGKRLEKYFNFGFSTKRLSKMPLGKFGVGAKSAMSIGSSYYTVESRYNGKLFRFNIYEHNIDSIIPRFNLSNNTENEYILFAAGTEREYKVYYEKTSLKNGVSIIIEAKKHHMAQYIDAVKSQMLYFDNIVCAIQHENGTLETIDYKAKIIYEDEHIVMSDNQYFTAPHLLLNKVNYGVIDWRELELEDKHGNIGIKVQPEEVDVNPSRESVLWTEVTKNMVKEKFNKVVEIATGMINEEMKETDLMKWLKNCYEISGGRWTRSTGVLGRLANIVDLSKVKPKFSQDSRIEFKFSDPLPGIYKRTVEYADRKNRENGQVKRYIRRTERDSMETAFTKPIILMGKDERASNRKDKYLLSLHSSFITMQEPHGTEEQINLSAVPEELKQFYAKSETTAVFRERVWELIKSSSEVIFYEKIEVPDSFKGTDEEEEPEAEQETVDEKKQKEIELTTAAERRKLAGKTIIHLLESQRLYDGRVFTFSKVELPIKEINDWQGQEVYYGNDGESDLMNLIGLITRDPEWDITGEPIRGHAKNYTDWEEKKWFRLNKNNLYGVGSWKGYRMQHFFDSPIKLVKVAQNNNRYYRDFKRAQEFFITIKDKTITMSNLLIQWNTARIIRNRLTNCAFLWNFEQFNTKYSDLYKSLCRYVDKHYREVEKFAHGSVDAVTGDTWTDLVKHLDNVQKFQEFVINPQATTEGISALAAELFGNRDLRDGMAVDPEIMRMMDEVQEFSVACGEMLNWIPVLTGYNKAEKPDSYEKNRSTFNISMELAFEISRHLETRGVNRWLKEQELPEKPAPDPEKIKAEYPLRPEESFELVSDERYD